MCVVAAPTGAIVSYGAVHPGTAAGVIRSGVGIAGGRADGRVRDDVERVSKASVHEETAPK